MIVKFKKNEEELPKAIPSQPESMAIKNQILVVKTN